MNLYNSSSIEPNKSPYKDFELYSVPTFESGMPEFVKGSDISSAKNFLDKFNDIALLADLMGHESIETTRIYLRRTTSEQQQIVDKVVTW